MRRGVRVHLAAGALLLGGCLPIAWLTPPGELDLGTGGRTMLHAPDAPSTAMSRSDPPTTSGSGFRLRATLHPLALSPDLAERHYDFGIGYALDPPLVDSVVQGPTLEASWLPLVARFDGVVVRIRLRTQTRLLYASDLGGPGLAVAAGAEADVTGFVDGGFAEGDSGGGSMSGVVGAGYGEVGVGLWAEVALAELGPYAWLDYSAGVAIHVPFSGGAGILCCMDISGLVGH